MRERNERPLVVEDFQRFKTDEFKVSAGSQRVVCLKNVQFLQKAPKFFVHLIVWNLSTKYRLSKHSCHLSQLYSWRWWCILFRLVCLLLLLGHSIERSFGPWKCMFLAMFLCILNVRDTRFQIEYILFDRWGPFQIQNLREYTVFCGGKKNYYRRNSKVLDET